MINKKSSVTAALLVSSLLAGIAFANRARELDDAEISLREALEHLKAGVMPKIGKRLEAIKRTEEAIEAVMKAE